MSDMLTEIVDTLAELKRMHQLNLELLEQLDVACEYMLDNKVYVPNEELFTSLLNKSLTLLNEIYSRSSDDGYHEPLNRRRVNRTLYSKP